ncbi:MAG: hypothetical protein F6K25_13010 [Okeania sp. SIO2G4]|uniref:hypothetical protein n=1 Tax=unclassified Okeania TaxID=2634635 RepID=UPI0013BBC3AC|nr:MULTISPECIES: hypothetical protein [unclassified Okeania]NEP03766.1 hypothetical protein [Okeania sp. SIO4D6]NEP42701.1 hypothetical protein [Okeania sp. SIO2H7]NEP74471.1 hypothetical protein [Okeania sp. SIO2G5]NEP94629.1 hypothetical protein [Okeania sp. SIO2F5]NEQ91569.1 hypothetical protein [Okeania sp. SIO2G4]
MLKKSFSRGRRQPTPNPSQEAGSIYCHQRKKEEGVGSVGGLGSTGEEGVGSVGGLGGVGSTGSQKE